MGEVNVVYSFCAVSKSDNWRCWVRSILGLFYKIDHVCLFRAKIELGDVTPHNIKQLKKLNTVVFPVSYNDKFYKDVLEAGELAKLAYYNDIVVGAVCCRIDTSENSRRLYIMTLGCLYPYRRLGIGSMMVEHVLNYVEQDGNFDSIFLWVLYLVKITSKYWCAYS